MVAFDTFEVMSVGAFTTDPINLEPFKGPDTISAITGPGSSVLTAVNITPGIIVPILTSTGPSLYDPLPLSL